jgi:arabinose-5-phosphate isomerase
LSYSDKQLLKSAQQTLQIESDAILQLRKNLNADFINAVKKIFSSKGRVVVTGIGKSAIIANKIVATFNSTGTPSMYMHAADAIHGDLGMIQEDDIIICISKSGESPEIKVLTPLLKHSGNLLIGMVGNKDSFLAKQADLVLDTTVDKEACPNNLAPTASTTAQLAMGDALAVCLLNMRGFNSKDFARVHPGGALGKKLYLKVDDLAHHNQRPMVNADDSINKVIVEMTAKRLGATIVSDKKGKVLGIITDGDLRRMIEKQQDFRTLKAKDIMSKNPKTIQAGELAVNALQIMRQSNITQIVVMDKTKYAGIVHVHDLLKEGLL